MTKKPLVLKVAEVAKLLRIQRAKVYILIETKALSGYKIGGDWRIRVDSVENLIGELSSSVFEERKKAA